MKRLFVVIVALFACAAANAGLLTVCWNSAVDPVGWNLYVRGTFGPDALEYAGTTNGVNRCFPFHNIPSSGLMQIGLSRVEYVNDNGVNRRFEGPDSLVTILNGAVISIANGGVDIYSANLDPNSN